MLQSLVWTSGRLQARAPPPFTHFLVRVLEPLPQVTEHRLHDDHSSQSPCTANTGGYDAQTNTQDGDEESGKWGGGWGGVSRCRRRGVRE